MAFGYSDDNNGNTKKGGGQSAASQNTQSTSGAGKGGTEGGTGKKKPTLQDFNELKEQLEESEKARKKAEEEAKEAKKKAEEVRKKAEEAKKEAEEKKGDKPDDSKDPKGQKPDKGDQPTLGVAYTPQGYFLTGFTGDSTQLKGVAMRNALMAVNSPSLEALQAETLGVNDERHRKSRAAMLAEIMLYFDMIDDQHEQNAREEAALWHPWPYALEEDGETVTQKDKDFFDLVEEVYQGGGRAMRMTRTQVADSLACRLAMIEYRDPEGATQAAETMSELATFVKSAQQRIIKGDAQVDTATAMWPQIVEYLEALDAAEAASVQPQSSQPPTPINPLRSDMVPKI